MQRGSLGSSSPLHAASTPVYGDVAVPRSDGEARFWLPYRLPLPVLTHDVLKHDVGAREYYSMFRLGAGWEATIHHRLVGDGRERVVHKGSINAARGWWVRGEGDTSNDTGGGAWGRAMREGVIKQQRRPHVAPTPPHFTSPYLTKMTPNTLLHRQYTPPSTNSTRTSSSSTDFMTVTF